MDLQTVQTIVTAIVAIAAILLGVRWQIAKTKLHQVRILVDDVAHAVDNVDTALADDTVDDKEYKEIVDSLVKIAADLKDVAGQGELNLLINSLRERIGSRTGS